MWEIFEFSGDATGLPCLSTESGFGQSMIRTSTSVHARFLNGSFQVRSGGIKPTSRLRICCSGIWYLQGTMTAAIVTVRERAFRAVRYALFYCAFDLLPFGGEDHTLSRLIQSNLQQCNRIRGGKGLFGQIENAGASMATAAAMAAISAAVSAVASIDARLPTNFAIGVN
ncbi:hypothetical protein M433DRAFT_145500 [Acidomyces richmondensis BFW]|nr:MAG: hypothetical protein FE78DRAFT_82199 [Acidomyces sp. 'richmondensis']KYG43797.1 hypothetical protein M433DRAFT_145500 [Acidomyces richmondensis BFW]